MIITCKVSELIKTLKENRRDHFSEYLDAIEKWKKEMNEFQEKLNKWVENTKDEEKPKEPVKPINYLKAYDKMIKKLEWHQYEIIELNEKEFENIVFNKIGEGTWAYQNFYSSVGNVDENHIDI